MQKFGLAHCLLGFLLYFQQKYLYNIGRKKDLYCMVGSLVGWLDGWMYKGVVPRKEEGYSTSIQEIM